jgi:hypothetical protein
MLVSSANKYASEFCLTLIICNYPYYVVTLYYIYCQIYYFSSYVHSVMSWMYILFKKMTSCYTCICVRVFSNKSWNLEFTVSGRSFINMTNNNGPSTLQSVQGRLFQFRIIRGKKDSLFDIQCISKVHANKLYVFQ